MPRPRTRCVRKRALIAAAVLLGLAARDGCSQTANDGFAANVSGDGYTSVNAVVVQPDGKILIGGIFNKVNGVTRSNLARLNIDGSLDTTFDPIAGGSAISGYVAVYALALQPDGRILVGGEFTTVGGREQPNIARLQTNGVVDTNFSAAAGWRVACLWVVLLFGAFTSRAQVPAWVQSTNAVEFFTNLSHSLKPGRFFSACIPDGFEIPFEQVNQRA